MNPLPSLTDELGVRVLDDEFFPTCEEDDLQQSQIEPVRVEIEQYFNPYTSLHQSMHQMDVYLNGTRVTLYGLSQEDAQKELIKSAQGLLFPAIRHTEDLRFYEIHSKEFIGSYTALETLKIALGEERYLKIQPLLPKLWALPKENVQSFCKLIEYRLEDLYLQMLEEAIFQAASLFFECQAKALGLDPIWEKKFYRLIEKEYDFLVGNRELTYGQKKMSWAIFCEIGQRATKHLLERYASVETDLGEIETQKYWCSKEQYEKLRLQYRVELFEQMREEYKEEKDYFLKESAFFQALEVIHPPLNPLPQIVRVKRALARYFLYNFQGKIDYLDRECAQIGLICKWLEKNREIKVGSSSGFKDLL